MNSGLLNQVIILFLLMSVGIYARKKNYINKKVNKGLSEILLNITFPLLIISSLNIEFSKEMLNTATHLFIYGVILTLVLIIVSKLIYLKMTKRQQAVLKFSSVFSNCSFMGFPILIQQLGSTGSFYGSVFTIVFNLFAFTYGVMLFTGEKDIKGFKKSILNPNIIAIFIGLIIFIFSIKLPYPISKSISLVGSMTTPLSMLILGALIAEMKVKEVFSDQAVYFAAIVRLIIAPLISILILKSLGASDIIIKVLVIAEAMPTAANTAVFAEKYNGDDGLASKCVFITTALSLLTIPFIISLI
ncbi:MAG: AEC family transporter [Clostridiaceae bacterium]|nr:AEC family transporter [Clostridiaceae bacterium]